VIPSVSTITARKEDIAIVLGSRRSSAAMAIPAQQNIIRNNMEMRMEPAKARTFPEAL
jgi:hypothetical protein